jgi:hypothetical protein
VLLVRLTPEHPLHGARGRARSNQAKRDHINGTNQQLRPVATQAREHSPPKWRQTLKHPHHRGHRQRPACRDRRTLRARNAASGNHTKTRQRPHGAHPALGPAARHPATEDEVIISPAAIVPLPY